MDHNVVLERDRRKNATRRIGGLIVIDDEFRHSDMTMKAEPFHEIGALVLDAGYDR
jgi:hypothetical protein